jgi:hypothetical protein
MAMDEAYANEFDRITDEAMPRLAAKRAKLEPAIQALVAEAWQAGAAWAASYPMTEHER